MAITHTLLQPPFFPPSWLQGYLPYIGPIAYLVRFVRLCWTLCVGLPLVFTAELIRLAFGVQTLPVAEGRRRPAQILVQVISSIVWSCSYGHVPWAQPHEAPFTFPPLVAEAAPRLSTFVFAGPDEEGHELRSRGSIIQPAPEETCVGVLRDGLGQAERRRVQVTWLWKENSRHMPSLGKDEPYGEPYGERTAVTAGEKVILYFVGGGYVSGTSLMGPFPWSLVRASPLGTRLLGVQYRHALHKECAFPAALQDGLAAWLYLVKTCGYDSADVVIVGESAGAGLSWSLAAYLGAVHGTLALGLPGSVTLFSPWLDLSLSHPGVRENAPLDILNIPQCTTARDCYLHNVHQLAPEDSSEMVASRASALELLGTRAFRDLRASHPLFSPAALDPRASSGLPLLLAPLQQRTRFFLSHADAELFAYETAHFHALLDRAGVRVERHVVEGGWHCCQTLGSGRWLERWLGNGGARACTAFAAWLQAEG